MFSILWVRSATSENPILAIDTNFIDELDKMESGGNFFYIPRPGSLNKILSNLGL
jgi:chemotaxis protein CheC